MANSTTTSCVTMFAFPNHQILKHKNKDVMLVNVTISSGVVSTNPVRQTSPLIRLSFRKEFQYPRHDFLSVEKADITISKIIQDLKTPFPLENINWGCLNFPANPTPESLDGIISGRLLKIAGDCAAESDHPRGPCMELYIRKVEKVSPEEYKKLLDEKSNKNNHLVLPKHPFADWIAENPEEGEQHIRIIQKLGLESPEENKYFGMELATIKEDDVRLFGAFDEEEITCCSICIRELEKGKQAIRMPCSHIFHGSCILKWISVNPTCPICRFELCTSTPRRN